MAKGTVLISGLNGYIASVSASALLSAGFKVRGTVRSLSSAQGLQDALAKYGSRLEVIEVPDITVPGAFDEAVKGVTAIAHLASPVSLSFTDPDPVIRTAVQGTKTMLASAKQFAGPQLKSFVLLSSIAAIVNDEPAPYLYTEKDWNNKSEDQVARFGKESSGADIYRASKTAAERALWDFVEKEKPGFVATAINPAFVMGPPLFAPSTPDKIHETTIAIYNSLAGKPLGQSPPNRFVDVRDVARLIVWAFEHPEVANGERYLAVGGVYSDQAIADILHEAYPDRSIDAGQPRQGYPPDFKFPPGGVGFDSSKAVKATGQDWISFKRTVLDAAKVFEKFL